MHHQFRIEKLEPLRLEISRFEAAVKRDLRKDSQTLPDDIIRSM